MQAIAPRKYDAPRREEQAAATRAAIIDAAAKLFSERGYGATTVGAVAAEARVAQKSVYGVGDKAHLLTLALDRAIVGDDDPIPLADRPGMQAALLATGGRDIARLAGTVGGPMLVRLYPLYRAFEQAAAVDPEIAERWREYQERRRQDVQRVVERLEALGALRPGLGVDRAVDTVWALVGWHPVALLVEQRGWEQPEIERWIEEIFVAVLLGGEPADPAGRAPESA